MSSMARPTETARLTCRYPASCDGAANEIVIALVSIRLVYSIPQTGTRGVTRHV